MKRVILMVIIVIVISVVILGTSVTLLPNPPLYPTPTYPKAIDFPDERPVPRR